MVARPCAHPLVLAIAKFVKSEFVDNTDNLQCGRRFWERFCNCLIRR